MDTFRVGRFAGVVAGAVAILGAGVYGPATLLGPLPTASVNLLVPPAAAPTTAPPALPAAGASTVSVYPGEVWTERELMQAVLLASSNNHADTLARWAFGSLENYRAAAAAWLAAHGLDHTAVVDATGLDAASAGTADDLPRLAGLAAGNPTIAEILANPESKLADRSGVDNTTATLGIDGVRTLSRSYTDAAGVCLLFTATVGSGESAFTLAGAFLGEPDYDTLTADLTALMTSARAGVTLQPVLAAGDAYARFETPWGDTASAVVRTTKTRLGWQPTATDAATVTLDSVTTGRAGQRVGTVALAESAAGSGATAPLVLETTLRDPGPGWRLLNPVPMVSALIQSLQSGASGDRSAESTPESGR